MSEEYEKKVEELQRQLDELKAQMPAPKAAFVRKPMPRFDPTEGMRMPPSAAQAMARVVPDVEEEKWSPERQANAWAQTKTYGPSGFGPPPERMRAMEEEARRKQKEAQKVQEPQPAQDHRSPQTRIFDQMVEAMVGGPNDTSKLR